MATSNPVISAAIIGYGVFLWLGLYLLVRARVRRPLIGLSVVGLLGQAAYFFAAALSDTAASPAEFVMLERLSWWTSVLPLAVWFHLSYLIAQSIQRPAEAAPLVPRRATAAYIAALLIVAVGSVSDLFNEYSSAQLTIRPGPVYPLYLLFQLATTVGALVHFVQARGRLQNRSDDAERPHRRQLMLLIGGSLLFALGGMWLGARYLWDLSVAPTPGYLFLLVGVALLGYGVAHYGMLLGGQNVQRDFVYTFTGIALLNVLYAALLLLAANVSAAGALALVTLVTLTHTAFDSGRGLLDRLFFTRDEQTARAEAREFATALGTEPVTPLAPADPEPEISPDHTVATPDEHNTVDDAVQLKGFKSDVRKALTGLKSPPRLVNSPLLTLGAVEQRLHTQGLPDNRLNRVVALREVLIDQIEALRPEEASGPKVGEAWRFYNVLHYPYVRELSRKGALAEARRLREERHRAGQRQPGELEQVLEWLADVDEDTFYKWQRRASDTIAMALWEERL